MSSDAQNRLQQDLAITPKTASLLIKLGYTKYIDLRNVCPNQLIAHFKDLPDVTARQAETYRRAARRMVWLGTQSDPQAQAKACQDWTQKVLIKRGVWTEAWDDLTGNEVEACFNSKASQDRT